MPDISQIPSGGKITREELIDLFGSDLPWEVVALLVNTTPMPLGDMRAVLRDMAHKAKGPSMVEKVARAIAAHWVSDVNVHWITYGNQARDAIKALRDPSTAVVEVMNAHAANGMTDWRDLHEAMIAEALK